jgi:hypothetical protein
MAIDALVTAGGTPRPDQLLYPLTQGKPKALLEIAGQPMIQWVLDALDGADTIRRVLVVGLDPVAAGLRSQKFIGWLPSQGSLPDNVLAGLARLEQQPDFTPHTLVVSSDIPALTPGIINWNVQTSLETDHEAYYSIIPQHVMETQFPGCRRSYFHFKDGTFTGGDMSVVANRVTRLVSPTWWSLFATRKNVFRQAAIVGFDILFLFAIRQLTVAAAERMVGGRMKIRGRVLISPYAQIGMDVDKPVQYELVDRYLKSRRP